MGHAFAQLSLLALDCGQARIHDGEAVAQLGAEFTQFGAQAGTEFVLVGP